MILAAATSMSRRVVSSFDIDRLRGAEDLPATERIPAPLDRQATHQIHVAADDRRKVLVHPLQVKQRPARIVGKGVQEVEITLRPEVLAKERTEDRELADLPAATEVDNLIHGEGDPMPRDRSRDVHLTASSKTTRNAILVRSRSPTPSYGRASGRGQWAVVRY